MPGKKGSSKGGGKGGKSSWEPSKISEDPVVQRMPQELHMMVSVRGVTWQFLDFTQRLPIDTQIFSIMHLITTRHGESITGLTLYKDEVHPRNLLKDPRRTLDAVGFAATTAAPTPGTDPEVVIYYDFAPHSSDCPLLLSAPRNFRIEARQEKENKEAEKRSRR